MQSSSHLALIWTQTIVHTSIFLIICAVFTVGWMRQRQFGFIVLAAWAAMSATWSLVFRLAVPLMLSATSSLGIDQVTLHMLVSISSGAILSLLLLLGACLLVFTNRRQSPPATTAAA